jgi:hypothetical protein
VVAVRLVAHSSEATTSKYTISHRQYSLKMRKSSGMNNAIAVGAVPGSTRRNS